MRVPIVYEYLIYRIKEKNRGKILSKKILNEIIGRTLIGRLMMPSCFKTKVVEDLIHFKLIKIISFHSFEIVNERCHQRIKNKLESI